MVDARSGWYRVQFPAPGYVAAFTVDEDGLVDLCPPIMRRWRGKPIAAFAKWARASGATFQRI